MHTSIRFVRGIHQPVEATRASSGLRRVRRALCALAISATLAGGAALAAAPVGAQLAPAVSSAAHAPLAVKAYGQCPSTTLICL